MGQVKREIYPRHKATCPNAKAKHPRRKFDGCRVYARYTITYPLTGKLLEEFNGALRTSLEQIWDQFVDVAGVSPVFDSHYESLGDQGKRLPNPGQCSLVQRMVVGTDETRHETR